MRGGSGTPVALAAGALLLCGLFAGSVARSLRLPRLTGYLLIGVLIGPYALDFIPAEGVAGLELVKGLAVSLIALAAGAELSLGLLRRVGWKVLGLCVGISVSVFVLVTAAAVALRPFLPFMGGMSLGQVVAVSALLGTIIVSYSPTVTIAIIQETKAAGSFTEFLMALVIIGDLVVLVGFAVAAGFTRASFGGGLDVAGLAQGVGWELFGSLVVGAAVGLSMLLYLVRVNRDLPLFIGAVCFASAEMGSHLHLSPLLLSLAAGAIIANLHPGHAERLNHAVQHAGLPVFALFFAAAGASLRLDALLTLGPVALGLAALRAAAIYVSTSRLAPRQDPRLRPLLWMGLISQAGVTFGLAALVRRTFPDFGAGMETLVVAMVALHELAGPVLTRLALQRSGEVQREELPRAGDAEPEKV
ncbi:MAG: cation:proton antiporter [Myxococcales bacterium]|nr:cation:proton antiporter [Myxococcales bacterium]